jgi:lipooligosaccharide transport system ATP-binding protein
MDKGKIAAEGSPRELIEHHSPREVVELRFPVGEQEGAMARLDGVAGRIEALPDRVLVYTDDADATTAEVHRRGLEPETVVARRSSLEDVFLRLAGRSLVD